VSTSESMYSRDKWRGLLELGLDLKAVGEF
jgi:hypothetical protein